MAQPKESRRERLLKKVNESGDILALEDGYYVYMQSPGTGALAAQDLQIIAEDLDRRNAIVDGRMRPLEEQVKFETREVPESARVDLDYTVTQEEVLPEGEGLFEEPERISQDMQDEALAEAFRQVEAAERERGGTDPQEISLTYGWHPSPTAPPKLDPWEGRSQGMKCRTCIWFVTKGTGDHRGAIGRCRRRAPTMNGYPATFETEWCGDHKLDEEKI